MAVPLPVVAAAAVVLVLLLSFIIYKLLQRRRKAREDSSEKSTNKQDYEKLGSTEQRQEPGQGEAGEAGEAAGAKGKKGKRKKKRKGKGKGGGSQTDGAIGTEGGLQGQGVTEGTPRESSNARLQLSILYSIARKQLLVTVHQGQNIAFGSAAISQVRLTTLPQRTQRFKTKCQPSINPIFEEFFALDEVYPQDGVLRVRGYRLSGSRKILVGELRVEVAAELSTTDESGVEERSIEYQWRDLIAVQDITDEISDTENITDPESVLAAPKKTIPMILISLQHKSVSGQLTVEIIKARNVKVPVTQKAPEAFVEMSLYNSYGGEVANSRTAICKGTYHPTFEETFYFPAIEYELEGLSLVISMFNKKFRGKDLLGRFCIGRDSTGEREKLHWELVVEALGEPIQGWYTLNPEG